MIERRPLRGAGGTGSLGCTLLDRRSSQPLHGARINCIGRDNRIIRFDADRTGKFSAKLPQGVYDLLISARGYLSLLVRGVGILAGHEAIMTRALVPGQGEDTKCEPATAVGGYVNDRFGHAVANVTIKMIAKSGGVTYTLRTDRDGAYLFNAVVPEDYILTVLALERRLTREDLTVASAKDFVRFDLRLLQV